MSDQIRAGDPSANSDVREPIAVYDGAKDLKDMSADEVLAELTQIRERIGVLGGIGRNGHTDADEIDRMRGDLSAARVVARVHELRRQPAERHAPAVQLQDLENGMARRSAGTALGH